jgi:hypothetical protein
MVRGPMPRRRRRLRLPRNAVYDAYHAAGGPTVVARALGVSFATLARWRRTGVVTGAADALRLAALVHRRPGRAQLALARRLAGLSARD